MMSCNFGIIGIKISNYIEATQHTYIGLGTEVKNTLTVNLMYQTYLLFRI